MSDFKSDKFDTEGFVKMCYGLEEFDIEDMNFNSESLSLNIHAKLPLNKTICSKCDGTFTELHDWQKKQARMPPFGNYLNVTLHLKKPRGHCSNCLKVTSSKVFFYIPSSHPWLVDLQNTVQG